MEFYDLKLFLPELLLIFSSIIILIYGIFFNKKKESLKNVFYIKSDQIHKKQLPYFLYIFQSGCECLMNQIYLNFQTQP